MGEIRQVALNLQQDITTSDDESCVTKRLAGKSQKEIEQILSWEIDGRTVFQTIAAYDRANILEKILADGVNINRVDRFAVHVAISQKAVNVMKILLAHKATIDRATEDGKTPLHIASELGYIKIVKELLENGAKPMLNQPEKTGCTPLTLACMTDHRETATCLMIYGAAINFDGAFPPLHASALMGYVDLVKMLLDRGAFVNLQDMKGETALHYATYKSHMPIVQLLLQKGAVVSCFDARGKTPLDLATDDDIKVLLENKMKTESPVRVKSRRTSGSQKSPPPDFGAVNKNRNPLNGGEDALVKNYDPFSDNAAQKGDVRLKERAPSNSDEKGESSEDPDANESPQNESGEQLNANQHNNSKHHDAETAARAEPEKKVSQQSTNSADSETGERKSRGRGSRPSRRNNNSNGNASPNIEEDKESNQQPSGDEDESFRENDKSVKKTKKKKGECVVV